MSMFLYSVLFKTITESFYRSKIVLPSNVMESYIILLFCFSFFFIFLETKQINERINEKSNNKGGIFWGCDQLANCINEGVFRMSGNFLRDCNFIVCCRGSPIASV